MDIGGIDVLIENNLPLDVAVDVILKCIRGFWTEMTVEYDYSLGYEIFVYKNQAAQDSWEIDCTDENIDAMIYIIFQEGLITVVHDNNEQIVESIKKAVSSVG
jgi:hypothetical protein